MIMVRTSRLLLAGFSLVVSTIVIASCAKDPYRVEIERFYFESINGSVSISKITVDTAITFEQAKPWLDTKLERVKERVKNSYSEQYDAARSASKPDEALVASLKARLDSANAGLYSASNHEITAFSAFITEKPYFEQVTVQYKVWVQGEVREQIFIRKVTANDTTLNVTEKGLKEYLKY